MSSIENLLQVMRDLRDPNHGCPWDLRQTSASIAPYTLDETHELLDAIERGDVENLQEELGDLLFNIVFHAQIAAEQGHFTFDDVAQGIADKMLRRHPHVFGEGKHQKLEDTELSQQWQQLKRQEKIGKPSSPGAESASNSPIYRARRLQQEAAELGFDWPDITPVFDKLDEEVRELQQAFASGDENAICDEVGDIMFVCINVARHAKINAEIALRSTNQKFLRRFAYVQEQMAAAGMEMEAKQLEQMESFWQQAKAIVD